MDSPPLFDRLLDAGEGGYFALTPQQLQHVQRNYRDGSNILETTFSTATGSARLTESLNSGEAGRLPWSELARRIEGIEGRVVFDLIYRPGTRAGEAPPLAKRDAERTCASRRFAHDHAALRRECSAASAVR